MLLYPVYNMKTVAIFLNNHFILISNIPFKIPLSSVRPTFFPKIRTILNRNCPGGTKNCERTIQRVCHEAHRSLLTAALFLMVTKLETAWGPIHRGCSINDDIALIRSRMQPLKTRDRI